MTREIRKSAMAVACAGLLAAGCAGLEITTLRPAQVTESRQSAEKALDGYVLYEPMVVVEISLKDVCLAGKDKDGKCTGAPVTQCSATTPFLLPDHTRPYLVRSRSGFGKAGVDVAISDGWRLGSIKDNSDNTAILGAFGKILGFDAKAGVLDKESAECSAPGLYQVKIEGDRTVLRELKLYREK